MKALVIISTETLFKIILAILGSALMLYFVINSFGMKVV